MQFPSAPPTRRSSPGNTPIFTIRPRRPEDLAPLAVVLAEQQPRSLYPISWPLPFPVDDFLQRDGELAAFVAEDNRTGETVGHVSVCGCIEPPKDPKEAAELDAVWAAGHGCAVSELRIIGVLFTDPAYAGTGMGSALFNAAIEVARKDGGRPVLDCLRTNTGPLAFCGCSGVLGVAAC